MIKITIRQGQYSEAGPLFKIYNLKNGSREHLGGKDTISEAVAFAQGILGSAILGITQKKIHPDETHIIMLELNPAMLAFDPGCNEKDDMAYIEGRNHPRSNVPK